ncbi:ADOP family duplicated permease [Acidicapsa dinghuensis]|uniref:ADOP family duplicated permease n=1 Tax=Acidicapsa dinghuensis TaxID=2218256 RepID=A0ABW1EKW1_9BACT|nr:ABC transporter permease [Acidicapsa dinghuensis]
MSKSDSLFLRLSAQCKSWLRAITHRSSLESQMDSELASHLEMLAADLMRAGYSRQEANRRARIALGSTIVHKDEMRASVGLRFWDAMAADLRYAARRLRRSVGFTVVASISLAMAIGANTTIFSLAKQLLYERLNVAHAADLRLLAWNAIKGREAVHHIWGDYEPYPNGRVASSSFSYPAYQYLRAHNHAFQDLFAFKETGGNATIRGQAQPVQFEMVSGNYYGDLEVHPQLGRAIQPSDDATAGAGAVVVISDGLWERQFGSSPAVLGEIVKLNDVSLTIVGVNPRGFTGAKNVQESPDFFLPISMQPLIYPRSVRSSTSSSLLDAPQNWWINVMGRIRPGVSDAEAQAELNVQLSAVVRATMPVRPTDSMPQMDVRDGSRGLFHTQRMFAKPMAVLLTMVGFVLLLACANIANLMLARGTQRQREMAIRLSLGAGRIRLARQMIVESVLLAVIGGAGGLLIGYVGSNIIPKLTGNAWERSEFHVHFDWGVFVFTALITLCTGLIFGLFPAIAAARTHLNHGLKESSASVTRRRKGWGGKSLVGLQIALSTLLVVGATLFLRTLASLNAVDVGFRTDHLLLSEIEPPARQYPPGKDMALHRRIIAAFGAVPGVEAVTPAVAPYVAGEADDTDFLPEGEAYEKDKDQSQFYNVVGNNFFSLMGIPILSGRSFDSRDTATSGKVAIINEALAKLRFPNQDPVGKRFTTDEHNNDGHSLKESAQWIQIVGVCADTKYTDLRTPPPPQFFLPFEQQTEVGGLTYELRTRIKPEAVVPDLRKALQQIDPDLPLIEVRTQQQQIDSDTQQERIFVALTSSFGMLALALASVGVYGVMAYSVASRTNEIGIRLALGARPAQVLQMILREAMWVSIAGIVVGLTAAMLLGRAIKSMLYGLQPADPLSFSSGALILIVIGLAASWIPARRAARIQPVEALRHE